MKGPVYSLYPTPMKQTMHTYKGALDAKVKLEEEVELNILHLETCVGDMELFSMS